MKIYLPSAFAWGCLLLLSMAVNSTGKLLAQQASFGNMNVFDAGKITFFGSHTLAQGITGSQGQQPGIIGAQRHVPFGVVNFMVPLPNKSMASDASHIDGYARKYDGGEFVFPVGDRGKYRPFILQTSADRSTTVSSLGAYFASDPQVAITDNMAGQNETVPLPVGGPFARTKKSPAVADISNVEYWDVDSAFPSKLTLTWGESSNFRSWLGRDISNLIMVGWDPTKGDGGQWVEIPAAVDQTSKLDGVSQSSLSSGTITTTGLIIPNDYKAYTFARKAGVWVTLQLKLFLEGGAESSPLGSMHNRLQVYQNSNVSIPLLPVVDPYNGSATYSDIANPLGVAGKVVDWIRVEIRTSTTPSLPLEAKSLLLKTDGSVVDVNGLSPNFNSYDVPVRIVVRHRNHLAVSSKVIDEFSSTVQYDFSTGLSQAQGASGASPQMKEIAPGANLWCLWAGDILTDNTIDASDYTPFKLAFGSSVFAKYDKSDLNLDGTVDSPDSAIFSRNFLRTLFSVLP